MNIRIKIQRSIDTAKADVDKMKCPPATKDVALNTKNRDMARKKQDYGPMNPLKPSMGYWKLAAEKWAGATPQEAMGQRCGNCVAFDVSKRMRKGCLPIAIDQTDPMSMIDKQLQGKKGSDIPGFPDSGFVGFGYCWMHHFKCHSARSCNTWAGGGPIKSDSDSKEWQQKNMPGKKKVDEIAGKCQKGYKTPDDPKYKTKKMYGNTYRNCVKADERKDPKTGTGKKPKGSGRRLYTDENPKDTVSVKFSTVKDIRDTLSKESFKSKSHKRQSQIINLIHQRVRVAKERTKDPTKKKNLMAAFKYITKRKEASKEKTKRMNKNRGKNE